jgi:hypothetical protein
MREALSLRGLGTSVFWRIRQAVRRFLGINKSQMEVNRFDCYGYSPPVQQFGQHSHVTVEKTQWR